MSLATASSPHIHSGANITALMLRVLLALVPAIIAYTWFFGWGLIINIAIAITVALGSEALMLRLRQRPLAPFLTDGSAVLTAVLLAFCIPPLAPWWITVMGAAFAIIVAKQLYGGLGYNPFNPAMVGYVMLLISFPLEMTGWVAPNMLNQLHISFIDTVHIIFQGHFPYALSMDALTMATPLDAVKIERGLNRTVPDIIAGNPIFSGLGGVGWEWVGGGVLLGGLWLIFKRDISWHIPVSVLGSLFVMSLFFFMLDPDVYPSPIFHLFGGATLLAAFFIATDPVSASTTPRGRIIYGIGIGVLIYVIRSWGSYPDAVAFAVLMMNMAAPTIDYYTQPPVFGHSTVKPVPADDTPGNNP
ncbi:MAG: electron transport complex subunit RsxD [Gammaproteobacteria bacterium]|nr:electron transport complex subunit RsxD [Gammaproteobacteria bacterium]